MKKITLLLSLYVAASLISCSKEDLGTVSDDPQSTVDQAYVELSISTPSTRAEDGGTDEGTETESSVKSVTLLTFDAEDRYVATYEGTVKTGTTTYSFTVDPSVRGFFAIANPIALITAGITDLSVNDNWTIVEEKLTSTARVEVASTLASSTDGFTMVNAGEYISGDTNASSTSNPLVEVSDALSMDSNSPTVIEIEVDRLVSKFTHAVSSSLNSATGTITADAVINGVKLTATNKSYYIFSEINKITTTGTNSDYRTDPNMHLAYDSGATDPDACLDELNWLGYNNGYSHISWDAAGTAEYVLENTASPAFHDYNNLTQAIVKATFTPSSLSLSTGTSWFVIYIEGSGDTYMTFEQVQSYYSSTASDDSKAKMDAQLDHILGTSSNNWGSTTLQALDNIANGGYKAATVALEENYIVQYYQGGVNYYDIFIQHDDAEAVGELGRWGMVRNNSYELTIASIKGHGYPYIPDPTDPDIKDPQNPDPKDPEPADQVNAFIEAYINVLPWTTWVQETDLM